MKYSLEFMFGHFLNQGNLIFNTPENLRWIVSATPGSIADTSLIRIDPVTWGGATQGTGQKNWWGVVKGHRIISAFEITDLSQDEHSSCLHVMWESSQKQFKETLSFLSPLTLCPRHFQLITKMYLLSPWGTQLWAQLDYPY